MKKDLELFLLYQINSLEDNGSIIKDYEENLETISDILKDNPDLIKIINRSKFLKYHTILLLKKQPLNMLNFLNLHFTSLILPEIYFSKKFIFFLTDNLYENLFADYLPNIRFAYNLISKHEFLINLFYECGYFKLLNSIIDIDVCKLYNLIFKNRIFDVQKEVNIAKQNYDVFYEIQRRNFENEIVFKENNLFFFKTTIFYKKGSRIHEKIYDDLEITSLYNLIEYDVLEMISVINYKKNNFYFIMDNKEIIQGCLDKNVECLRFVRMYYTEFDILSNNNFYKKIVKFLNENELNLGYEILLLLVANPNIENLQKIITEKLLKKIFEILEYSITECTCCINLKCEGMCTLMSILDFLFRVYNAVEKKYFYKISILILLNEIGRLVEHKFIYTYNFDIISYFKINKSNISRILFPFSKKKITNIKENDIKNLNDDEFSMKNIKKTECNNEKENNKVTSKFTTENYYEEDYMNDTNSNYI